MAAHTDVQSIRRLAVFAAATFPWTLAAAQGQCSVSGMTLEEALAAWDNAQKKAQMDKDSYLVVVQRMSRGMFKGKKGAAEVEEMGVLGNLTINGTAVGSVVENDALRVKAGEYKGVIRYVSSKNLVQGPLANMSTKGDFLLEVSGVSGREAILFHQGTQPWHSKGCILAGAAQKKKVGDKDVISISDDSTLAKMRQMFYGTSGEANACPNKTVRVTIKDI